MKKMFVLLSLMTMFLTPVIGQAASADAEDTTTTNTEIVKPRAVYRYRFSTIPPKTFNGMNRIYYEYDSRYNVYVGYYQ